jgi:hypothetical protein
LEHSSAVIFIALTSIIKHFKGDSKKKKKDNATGSNSLFFVLLGQPSFISFWSRKVVGFSGKTSRNIKNISSWPFFFLLGLFPSCKRSRCVKTHSIYLLVDLYKNIHKNPRKPQALQPPRSFQKIHG